MMNVIEVRHVTKTYKLYDSPRERLLELVSLSGKKHHHEFHALQDVSLTVKKGDTVALIGRNGSGKSTLLKLICGIMQPSVGDIRVHGRISSLLELGAGFNPEFTGRENVYMNGALMGLTRREMEDRFTLIESFADIDEFIDQPVKVYSSGMYMRLAFATAINVDPDILVIDEVLAVGDLNFQSKCLRKVRELKESGTTILLVTHSMPTVENISDKVCLLDHGQVLVDGASSDAVPAYYRLLHASKRPGESSDSKVFRRWGTKQIEITDVSFLNSGAQGREYGYYKTGDPLGIRIGFMAHEKIHLPSFGIAIHHENGTNISGFYSRTSAMNLASVEGKGIVECIVDHVPLLPGKYFLSVGAYDTDCFTPYDHWEKCLPFTMEYTTVKGQLGILHLEGTWQWVE